MSGEKSGVMSKKELYEERMELTLKISELQAKKCRIEEELKKSGTLRGG